MGHEEIRRDALRGTVPAVLTVAAVVGGAVGGRAGHGWSALLVATVVAVGAALAVLAALAVVLRPRRSSIGPRGGEDLAAQWARVEPGWSGREAVSSRRARGGHGPRPSTPDRPHRPTS